MRLKNLYINNRCTYTHHNNCLTFSVRQKSVLAAATARACKSLENYLIRFPTVEFILLNEGVYWNFPFTYGKTMIVVTPKFFSRTPPQICKTLVHELVHLDQRRSPMKYKRYYRTLGFRKRQISFGKLAPYLLRNPDAEKYEWTWTGYDKKLYIPVALLVNCKFHSVLIEMQRGVDHIKLHNIKDVKSYATRFGTARQLFHPNEIIAHIIADLVVDKVEYPQIDYEHIRTILNS